MSENTTEKMDKLARDILILSRNTLLVNMRFLDAALSQFMLVALNEITLATDGAHLFYDPKYVLQCYKFEKETSVRDYLHIVFHCIFQHMYGAPNLNRPYWDLACDIAVEYTITELGLKAATAKRQSLQEKLFEQLKSEIKYITAEKIYRFYMDKANTPIETADLRGLFYADNHELWYMTATELQDIGISEDAYGQGEASARAAQAQTWKNISRRMQQDLETFSKQRGDTAGNLMQNLTAVNREKYDYTAFLKKFAVLGEAMKINDDEYDYIFYTYGMQLYGKMPLIEPLEYKEVKRIREFVIAIDTSGSVSGELVQRFLQKTYNILKSTENFFTKINLHIIQCDAAIQEDAKITSQEEFDTYLKTMKLHGLGGTDFRPVFGYVEWLREKKEFTNLKGLIYFTDGCGVFPERKPDYDTAFVFIEDDYNNPNVPPWAIKLVLQKNEI